MKKVEVDKDLCIGCGACFGGYPEVFEQDDDGLAKSITSEVDDTKEQMAIEASEGCPVDAISVK